MCPCYDRLVFPSYSIERNEEGEMSHLEGLAPDARGLPAKIPASVRCGGGGVLVVGCGMDASDLICVYEYGTCLSTRYVALVKNTSSFCIDKRSQKMASLALACVFLQKNLPTVCMEITIPDLANLVSYHHT